MAEFSSFYYALQTEEMWKALTFSVLSFFFFQVFKKLFSALLLRGKRNCCQVTRKYSVQHICASPQLHIKCKAFCCSQGHAAGEVSFRALPQEVQAHLTWRTEIFSYLHSWIQSAISIWSTLRNKYLTNAIALFIFLKLFA